MRRRKNPQSKTVLLGVLLLGGAGFLLLIGRLGFEAVKDRAALVQRDVATPVLVHEDALPCGPRRNCREITLAVPGHAQVRISLSLPATIPEGGVPSVVLLGGFDIGMRSIYEVPNAGANAVIGYDYPLDRDLWYEAGWLKRVFVARTAVREVPAHVLSILRWTRAQAWSDGRASLLGFSLGALFLPAAHHMAALHGEAVGPSVIAYGGADLAPILRVALAGEPGWKRVPLTALALFFLRDLEPAYHLPKLKGEFLLINGNGDRRMPAETVERLQRLTPQQKTIVTLDSDHMMPGNQALMDRIVDISRRWLIERKAVNS